MVRDPRDVWGHVYLGFLLAEDKAPDRAATHWRRALAIDPENAVAHYLIGQTHYRQGRFDLAAGELATATRLRDGSVLRPWASDQGAE